MCSLSTAADTTATIRGLADKKASPPPPPKDDKNKDKEDDDKNKEDILGVVEDWGDLFADCDASGLAQLYDKDAVYFPSLPGYVFNNFETFQVSIPPGYCWVFCDGDATCPTTCVDQELLGPGANDGTDYGSITDASIEDYYDFLCLTLSNNNFDVTSVDVS